MGFERSTTDTDLCEQCECEHESTHLETKVRTIRGVDYETELVWCDSCGALVETAPESDDEEESTSSDNTVEVSGAGTQLSDFN